MRAKVRRWWKGVRDQAPSGVFGMRLNVTIKHAEPYFRVHVGPFDTRHQASRAQTFLQREDPEAFTAGDSLFDRRGGNLRMRAVASLSINKTVVGVGTHGFQDLVSCVRARTKGPSTVPFSLSFQRGLEMRDLDGGQVPMLSAAFGCEQHALVRNDF